MEIEREQLINALDKTNKIIKKTNVIPIYGCIKIDAKKEGAFIYCANNEVALTQKLAINSLFDDLIIVNHEKITKICKELPKESKISITSIDNKTKVSCGKYKASLASFAKNEFPSIDTTENKHSFIIDSEILKPGIEYIKNSMAKNDARTYLNGMLIDYSLANKINLVATDGHRLSISKLTCETKEEKEIQLIIPYESVNILLGLLKDFVGEVIITMEFNRVFFTLGDIIFSTRVIDGKYPDYNRVIPKLDGTRYNVKVNTGEFISGLKKVQSLVANDKYIPLKVTYKQNDIELLLSVGSESCIDYLSIIEYSKNLPNDGVSVGYNLNYLLQALSPIPQDDQTEISFIDGVSSSYITNTQNYNNNFCVLMPMQI